MGEADFLRRLEPEIKVFHFEKADGNFEAMPEDKKQEEKQGCCSFFAPSA